ncbi:MAG TPA: Ldh family oxidoreductase [Candidatus Bathyarchaeia archaeon]|nr:Ldh family oxidoreductase [Candidatus Bathyarchaeia archaeon]
MSQYRNHYKINEIVNLAFRVLQIRGYPEESAKATAHALLEADKRGIFSHGLAGGAGLEEAANISGLFSTVNPKATPEILPQKYPTLAVIDAHSAPGHITSIKAVELVKKLARQSGFAKVIVKEANHFGAAGVWSEMIAQELDLIGIVTCTTSALAKVMGDDPIGLDYTKGAGKELRLGTNPIAISIPYTKGILTLDMACTRMAANYCIKAYKTGEMLTIPEYVADKNYQSTLNPKDFIEIIDGKQVISGSIFPLGSTLAGYKGDALLRMIEIDHSIGGGPISKVSPSPTSPRISLMFQAQIIDFHYTKNEALQRVKELMQDYEENYFGSASRWPGERAQKALEYSMKEGIPYHQGQIDMLKRAAKKAGLDFNNLVHSLGDKPYPTEIFKK